RQNQRGRGGQGYTHHQDFFAALGAGNIGEVSCDCAFFCTSTSLTSSGGEEADTGTPPLSAPHTPLNTSVLSPVAVILANADSGVPMRSTPRTSSGARPSV